MRPDKVHLYVGSPRRATAGGTYWTARVGPAAAEEAAALASSHASAVASSSAGDSGTGREPYPEPHENATAVQRAVGTHVAVLPVPTRDTAAEAVEQLVGACLQNILRECVSFVGPRFLLTSLGCWLVLRGKQPGSCAA